MCFLCQNRIIMAITSIKRKPIHIFIPPAVSSMYKIEIITSSGATDVTGYTEKGNFKQAINPDTGTFDVTILNPDDKFKDLFAAEDKIKLYKDYGTSATTLRFQGIIENVDQANHRIKLKGKSLAKDLLDYTVVGNYTDQTIHSILTDIISQVNSEISDDYTTTNIDTTGTGATQAITINWNYKTAWECIEILCKLAEYDFYVDENKDCYFFSSRSVTNTTDAVAHSYNILEIKAFSEDVDKVKNKIIVNGAIVDGIPLLYTAEDSDSISDYGLREEVITDSSLDSWDEITDRGDAELALKKDPPIVGEVKSTLLVGLKPGDMLSVSAPADGIPPSTYRLVEFEDIIENNGPPTTKVKLEKYAATIPQEFRNLFLKQKESEEITNINKLKFSYLFNFDSSTGIDDGASNDYSISEGYLVFTGASGYMQSDSRDTTDNVSEFEVKAVGENLVGNITYQVSVDNGTTWQTVNLNTLTTTTSEGSQLKIRVTTTSADAKINTLAILYSTS